MPKMVHFGEFLKTWSLRSNSVTRQVSFNKTKVGGKCQNWKTQMWHFGWFSNTVHVYLIDFSAISKVLSLSQNPVNFNDFLHSFLMDWQVQVMCLPGYLMTSFKAQECKRVNFSLWRVLPLVEVQLVAFPGDAMDLLGKYGMQNATK